MANPFRADQIGSLLRPPDLLQARQSGANAERPARARGPAHPARLRQTKRTRLRHLYRWRTPPPQFHERLHDAVEGFDFGDAVARTWQAGEMKAAPVSSVTGIVTKKLRQSPALDRPRAALHQSQLSRRHQNDSAQRHAISCDFLQARVTDAVYKDHSELLWAVVEIMKSDLAKLASDGVSYIQIDAPRYSYYMDPKWREWIRTEIGTDPDALSTKLSEPTTPASKRSPPWRHAWHPSLPRQQSQPLVRRRRLRRHRRKNVLHSRCRSLSSRIRRRPLRHLRASSLHPKGKTVVLGLVSSKIPQMEIRRPRKRIDEAAKFVPMENLALSPNAASPPPPKAT